MKIIFLGGINGSGKTTVAEALTKSKQVLALHGTTELMRLLGIPAGDYEILRKTNEETKKEALYQLFRDLSSTADDKIVVVTAHYVKVLNGNITPSFGPWYKYCNALVLLRSSPTAILRRIEEDEAAGQRMQRNLFSFRFPNRKDKEEFLANAQALSIEVMMRASKLFQVPSYQIENSDGKLKEAVKKLTDIVENL